MLKMLKCDTLFIKNDALNIRSIRECFSWAANVTLAG